MDSMKVMNESRYFVISSCLLAGQFPFLSMFFLELLFVCESLYNGSAGGPLFGRLVHKCTLRRPVVWSYGGTPPFSRAQSASLIDLGSG